MLHARGRVHLGNSPARMLRGALKELGARVVPISPQIATLSTRTEMTERCAAPQGARAQVWAITRSVAGSTETFHLRATSVTFLRSGWYSSA